MKTTKLYWQNPLGGEFSANVIDSKPSEHGSEVILDQTCFYPESGGQPCDHGKLGDMNVVDVQEDGEAVVHYLDGNGPAVGSTISGIVDMNRREDHSCQHTAQHIISAVAQKLWDVATVGFHLGRDSSTVDLQVSQLTNDQLLLLENQSNDAVSGELPVSVSIHACDDITDARLKKEFKEGEQVRLVSIGDLDKCACCGTHLLHTGQVGLIKLGKIEKVRKSMRVEFYAGRRMLKEFGRLQNLTDTLATMTGSGKYELPEFVNSSSAQHKRLKRENAALFKKLAQSEARELNDSASSCGSFRLVCVELSPRDIGNLKETAMALLANDGIVALLGAEFEGKASMVFARSDDVNLDIAPVFKNAMNILGGRGGGRPNMAQGGGGDLEKLGQALASAKSAVSNV